VLILLLHVYNFPELQVLNFKRCGATAVKIGNHLYVAGGGDMPFDYFCKTSTEMLDLQKCEEWVTVSKMAEPRKHFSSAVFKGLNLISYVYEFLERSCTLLIILFIAGCMVVTGGYNGSKILSSCEKYRPNCNEWQPVKPMIHDRKFHAMACLNGE